MEDKQVYETIIIFDTTKETIAKEEIKDYADVIQGYSMPKKIKVEDTGVKKLAYELKGCKEGYYTMITWEGTIEQLHELERLLRIDDHVLKFLIVKCEDFILEDLPDSVESEQNYDPNTQVDAMDVLLGFADYTKKKV